MPHKPATSNPLIHALDYIFKTSEDDSFSAWLTKRRAAGESFASIAEDLAMLTDGYVRLSDETISRYCRELGVEVAA